ncbi:efflux RND transporter permease subunit [Shewanella sp. A32]|uniref:efflux RND transporter permease subunit n=1 Tax=Shewanella sp. A32 TaxID=3031327 RepID=UPI0023B93A23|nr:efflux RND transporter permease subunit [Shewanella sp. A32]MDF0534289.1 efflux RND transporter permease subunit [Shewanella sp. A32]
MNLTALALKRPVTTSMFFIAILLFGMAAARLLPLEMFPGIDIPEIDVQVPYKGSSPAEVERDITNVLEESLATMGGVDELKSKSSQDGSEIEIKMKWGENVATRSLEAREKIDAVRHLLPDDVERVLIQQFSTADMPVLTVRISSDRELSAAFDLLDKQLRRPLERVDGVSKVTLYGVDQKQIEVRIDAQRLAASGITLPQLRQRLLRENFIVSGGNLRDDGMLYQVSPKGEFRNLDEISALTIAPGIHLGDVADIRFALPERTEGRHLDQKYAVGLDIFKESGANLVDVSNKVMKVIDTVKNDQQFRGIKLFIMDNQGVEVESSLHELLMSGMIGALLSFVVLYLFLRNLPMTLIVVSSVPISIGLTLAGMYFLGYSLNILSMMGLLLAIGMLIDNAVVVSESVLQEQQHHHGGIEGIIAGVDKVSLAVLAGTLTTAIVFLPNIFGVKVQLTVMLEHVAVAICISLAASLLVAKTLIPLLLAHIKLKKDVVDAAPPKMQRHYQRSLDWVLSHPKISTLIAVLILLSTALPLQFVQKDNEDSDSTERMYINYQVDGRHSLRVTEAMVNQMEDYLYANKEKFYIDAVYSYYATDEASSVILLKPDLPVDVNALKKQIRAGFPKYAFAKPQFGWGDETSGVRVTLTGRSTSELIQLSQQVIPLLSHIKGLQDVRSELNGSQKEVVIHIDRELAARMGLKLNDIASTVGTALRGTQLRSFRHDPSGELRIELLYEQQWQQSLETLKQLPIARIGDKVFSLGTIASIAIEPRFDVIRHYNRETALSIGANLEGITMEQAQKEITQVMQHVNFPDGYRFSLTGGFEKQDEEQSVMLINMLLAVAMIYIVMAALFESLLLPSAIITSILFSITGVFWALLLTHTPMSVMAMIGILVLMGIVVNNGIVLVDQINQMTPDLDQLSRVISDVCITRLRPVLMTVGTTILGLVPLAVGHTQIGAGGPAYAPMAIAIIGGLGFSTLTSLYLVPLCYQAFYRMRHHSAMYFGHALQLSRSLLPWT